MHVRVMRAKQRRQSGAALLLAMVILALVATLAGGMVWQNARAIQVEGSDRARLQSAWVVGGALDWAILILVEDLKADTRGANAKPTDHLGEPWAVPLAEARLSTFLAADKSGTTTGSDDGPEAFLSGSITDLQAKWNLHNVINAAGTDVDPDQVNSLKKLCDAASLPGDTAGRLAEAYKRAYLGGPGASAMPKSMRDVTWLGFDRAVVAALEPFVMLLPTPIQTPVNLNTAGAEVIAAAIPNFSIGDAQNIVEQRQTNHLKDTAAIMKLVPPLQQPKVVKAIDVKTQYFEVRGRLRLDSYVLEEVTLVRRETANRAYAIHRERVNLKDAGKL